MLIWFAVAAPFLVAEIFKSPMVDYRMVALGALLPLIEVVIGQPFVLHTLLGPVVVLTVVMLGTINRRLLRRRLLGIPIGMFFHLVLDATWSSPRLFWWPAFGFSLADEPVPETTGVAWRLLLELAGIALAVFAYRRYGLDRPAARTRLLRTGHLTVESELRRSIGR
ncbi:MAG: hypothetical protein AAF547_19020 [Actinomycetota bacterium]